VCSRRKADDLIAEGRVVINGEIAQPGSKVNPAVDIVTVDGRAINLSSDKPVYLVYNKPRGVVSTMSDPHAKQTLAKAVPEKYGRLFPVGRLDKESQGLMLLTNDGDLAEKLTHPRYQVEKEYFVSLERKLTPQEVGMLRRGDFILADGHPAGRVRVNEGERSKQGNPRYYLVLEEGRNREIRQLMTALEVDVKRLKRIRIGNIVLGNMPPGDFRQMSPEEERALLQMKRHLEEQLAERNEKSDK
jgi:23S rRNA pseudouridine2605 synthase